MPDYQRMYYTMFNAATATTKLANDAAKILREAQLYCEELVLEEPETAMVLHIFSDREDDSD